MNPHDINSPDTYQEMQDDNHVRLLVIFHYLLGILELLGSFALGAVTVMMKRVFESALLAPPTLPATPPAGVGTGAPPAAPALPPAETMEAVTNIALVVYGGSALVVLVLAILTIISARGMATRKWETLSLIVAGCQCLVFPIGTVLGILTFVVLLRPSVALQYRQDSGPNAA